MDSGGQEQNYWPGFVDALSNVVLTLIFVLVVFVFALSMAAHKVEQRAKEVKEAEQRQQQQQVATSPASPQETIQLKQQLQQAQEVIKQLQAKVKTSDSSETAIQQENKNTVMTASNEPTKPITGTVGLKQAATGDIQLFYPNAVAEADEKSMQDLNHALEGAQQKVAHHKILLLSYVGQEPYSAAMRLAYYRAITMRNLLISKGFADATSITTKIMPSTAAESGHVEIIYQ